MTPRDARLFVAGMTTMLVITWALLIAVTWLVVGGEGR